VKSVRTLSKLISHRSRRSFLAALSVVALFPAVKNARAADDDTFRYRGREYMPTGSHVARRLTWSSKIPFDKTYAELTPAQKAHVRDQYSALAPDEEPPFPKEGLRALFALVDLQVDQSTPRLDPGPLTAVARVDAEGDAQTLSFYKTPNAFAMAAVGQALLKTPFKPARRNGAPVAMDFLLAVDLL